MKKTFLFMLVFSLMISLAFAQQGLDASNKMSEKNSDNDSQIQQQVRIQTGNYQTSEGKKLQIQQKESNQLRLMAGDSSASTSMQMNQEQTQNGTKLNVELSNGRNSEIKVMPDVASQKAIEQLRLRVCSEENNCTIELKEVGNRNQTKAAYEVKVQKQAKMFGLFNTRMQVQTQIDAENGEIIQTRKPWWAFLASESQEEETEE